MRRLQLIAARARKNWTLEQASEHISCSPNTLNRWELGTTNPSAYHRAKLCEVYGMTMEELGLLDPRDYTTRAPAQTISKPKGTNTAASPQHHETEARGELLRSQIALNFGISQPVTKLAPSQYSEQDEMPSSLTLLQREVIKRPDFFASAKQVADRKLLKDCIDRHFTQDTTYDFLSSNIKTMSFRDD